MEKLQADKSFRNNKNTIACSSEYKKDSFPACTSCLGDKEYDSLVPTSLTCRTEDTRCSNMSINSCFDAITSSADIDKKQGMIPSPRRSTRLNNTKCPVSPITQVQLSNNDHGGKENISEQVEDNNLKTLFSTKLLIYDNTSSSNNTELLKTTENGRHGNEVTSSVSASRSMISKLDGVVKKNSIPTKSFYSSTKSLPKPVSPKMLHVENPLHGNTPTRVRNEKRKILSINKGVRHKIRRPYRQLGLNSQAKPNVNIDLLLSNMRNEKLRNLITSKRIIRAQIEKVHDIFRSSGNPIEMARPLSALCSADDSNNNVFDIMPKHDDIELPETGFSDIETDVDECDLEDENIPIITFSKSEPSESDNDNECTENQKQLTKRKFFKTGHATNTKKEVQITDHIKATVCNGKLRILDENIKIKKKPKVINLANKFSDEQATVDKILEDLNDTAFGEADQSVHETASLEKNRDTTKQSTNNDLNDLAIVDKNQFYESFHNRIPYNTTDPTIEEQQRLLLDFLISFNICTEENFVIFIGDPENHKEEASRILDQFIVKGHTNFRERIPYNTSDPMLIAQQNRFLEYLIENEICTEENFNIFIVNYDERKTEAEQIIINTESSKSHAPTSSVESVVPIKIENNECDTENEIIQINSKTSQNVLQSNCLKLQQAAPEQSYPMGLSNCYQPLKQTSSRRIYRNWMGQGENQYQIDAGQKYFGPQQCKQCGLLYNVHEPEEEKLHREFHSSLNILRYKGWIDEDIVAIYPEWGNDGRIIRLTNTSHTKRKERLSEILKVVDKELGFSSYIFPATFVCYCAVRKSQIVGLCLVEPLPFANKYMSIKGIDCCTEEKYESKCGISRLWISPLHRRMRIASKLIQAIQLNTLPGEQIPIEKIAFSAPTEAGKKFAQKITKSEHFLVYQ